MARYAETTTVSVETSRNEIERTLRRYKADSFAYMSEGRAAIIAFSIGGRRIRFSLLMPDPTDPTFTHSSRGPRADAVAEKAWEQACRSQWRALALVIKAKLEAVVAGITTIEDEFLAHTVLPNGRTVSQEIQPQIEISYRDKSMPLLLGGPMQ